MPVVPQLDAPWSGQSASLVPDATDVHVPRLPATLHATHAPVHAVLQQTPSTQPPLAHCDDDVHASPSARSSLHVDCDGCPARFSQNAPLTHAASLAQLVAHAVPVAHAAYGLHDVVV